jgi:uncharacterized protein YkwD
MTRSLPALRPGLTACTRAFAALLIGAALASCGEVGGGLAPGLVTQMDTPGATLDRASAIGIVNQYRGTVGASPLTSDAALDATAQSLASQYASTGNAPKLPSGAAAIRVSAGYNTFAETFSGWRNSPADAAVLASSSATRAGIATIYDANSTYGIYWVLVLGS